MEAVPVSRIDNFGPPHGPGQEGISSEHHTGSLSDQCRCHGEHSYVAGRDSLWIQITVTARGTMTSLA